MTPLCRGGAFLSIVARSSPLPILADRARWQRGTSFPESAGSSVPEVSRRELLGSIPIAGGRWLGRLGRWQGFCLASLQPWSFLVDLGLSWSTFTAHGSLQSPTLPVRPSYRGTPALVRHACCATSRSICLVTPALVRHALAQMRARRKRADITTPGRGYGNGPPQDAASSVQAGQERRVMALRVDGC